MSTVFGRLVIKYFHQATKNRLSGRFGKEAVLSILAKRAPGHQVTIDGFAVPRVEVAEDAASGQWHVTYDGRFGIVAESLDELQRWLWIVANAQAVGEGYSCHGANSVYRPNPHQVQVMCIGSIATAPEP